jgi:CRP-like cAMP-binding protein
MQANRNQREDEMISPEVLRRWPFFAGLSHDHVVAISKVSNEIEVDEGEFFFHEEDHLDKFYLTLNGRVNVVMETLERDVEHKVSEQYLRDLKTKDVVVSTLGPGDVFGWSGLVSPHTATAGAQAASDCEVVVVDAKKLVEIFDEDCEFGYQMMQKAAQVIRDRLHDTRVETLSCWSE